MFFVNQLMPIHTFILTVHIPDIFFKGMVFGQELHFRRIINNDELLAQRLGKLVGYFVNCGYLKNF